MGGRPLILEPTPPRSSASIRVPTGCLHTLVAPANGRCAALLPCSQADGRAFFLSASCTEAVTFTLPMHFSQS